MIDEKTVEHIASLARLKTTEEEKKKFVKELSSILDAFSELKQVEADVKPSFHPIEIKNVLREDKEEKCISQDQALSNTEQKEDKFFKGPRIV